MRLVRHARWVRQSANEVRVNSVPVNFSQRHHLFMLVRAVICHGLLFPTLLLQIYIHYVPLQTCRTIGILNIFVLHVYILKIYFHSRFIIFLALIFD